MTVNKKKKKNTTYPNFAVLANCTEKIKENEKKDKYLDLVRELKEAGEHKSDGDTN